MTRYCFLRCIVLTLVSLFLVAGCDQPTKKKQPAKRTTKVETGKLPKLGDHFGPVDNGRLEVAPPADWHVPPRSSKFVARFQQSEEEVYPSIIITAEDDGSGASVTKKNVARYAKKTADEMKKQKSAAKLAHTVLPVEVGSFVGIIYKRRGKAPFGFKKVVVDRRIVETVVDGRKYMIELRTREGDAERYQQHLLAVVGGLKFVDPNSPDTAIDMTPEEPPAAEPEEKAPEKKAPEKKAPEKAEPEKKEPEKKAEPAKKAPEKEKPAKKEPAKPAPEKKQAKEETSKEEQPEKTEPKKDG